VKKLRRFSLIILGAVVALVAVLLTGVNLYVQSQGTHAKIQQELSRRLGTTLAIRSMSVTPWGGLELSGITIAQTSPVGARHFLEAKTFRLRVRFLSLFSRRLVIKEVALVDPKIVWPQDAEGKWKLPSSQRPRTARPTVSPADVKAQVAQTSQAQTAAVARVTPANLPSPPQTTVNTKAPTQETRLAVPPEVRRVTIKNGNFSFLDQAGRLLASFNGVNFRTSIRSALALHGDAKVARISLQDRFFLEELRSPLRYEPDVLELSRISARAGNGQINGYFAMQPEAEDSPFTTSVKFRDVLADEIIANAGGPRGTVQGKLEGNFQASGKTADPEAFIGKGEISLRDGRVQQYSLLVLLGELLQIEELRELHLEQAEAKYHVNPGLVTIDELILRSPNIRLTASGTVAFNGNLKLDSQLAINDKIRAQLFKAIRQNFQPINEPGYSAIDFQVGGTIDRPSTNLMDRLVGRGLSDMINSFLGGGKKERSKKKKKQVEDAKPATPQGGGASGLMPAAPLTSASPPEASSQASATPTPASSP
jgi:type II secretion system protein N